MVEPPTLDTWDNSKLYLSQELHRMATAVENLATLVADMHSDMQQERAAREERERLQMQIHENTAKRIALVWSFITALIVTGVGWILSQLGRHN